MSSIPNIIHFIFGVTDDPDGRTFAFVQYLAVVTAWATNQPERIYLHCQYEPVGIWWERARPFVTINHVDAPEQIYGNPVLHPAHKADVIRLEQLFTTGGIYLDMDVICVRSFEPLRQYPTVLAREGDCGLGNAVILAAPGALFLRRWQESYKDFDGIEWAEHSVKRPWLLARAFPQEIEILEQGAFFFPLTIDPPHVLWTSRYESLCDPEVRHETIRRVKRHLSKTLRFKKRKRFDPPLRHFLRSRAGHLRRLKCSYCIHLWRQMWWERYLCGLDPQSVAHGRTNFALIVRHSLRYSDIYEDICAYANEADRLTAGS